MFTIPTFHHQPGVPANLNPLDAARAYDATPIVDWEHPSIKKSYSEFTQLIVRQYDKLIAAGLSVEYVDGEPYANSRDMFADLDNHGHIRTRATGGDLSLSGGNPMLDVRNGILVNDAFRTVHDVLGHYATRSSFGPDGETVAWLSHRLTVYPIMRLALWLETRGQAAWTNWAGDHSSLALKDRPYADGLPRLISEELI